MTFADFRRRFGCALAALVVLAAGCNRAHYRRQADVEARQIVTGSSRDPRWALPDFTIRDDVRARYHDVASIDRPPMPPDDPAAHRLMHYVDGKKGYPRWHRDGDRQTLENPAWRRLLAGYVQTTEHGVRLNLDDAVRLASVNNPDYRSQVESLYLSALDVSAERFRFDYQFFGTNTTTFEHRGRERDPGGETNTLTNATDLELHKRFATGAEMLVGFANSFVWQFAGDDTNSSMSILNFNLVQPLLRAGGREVALEQLTIVERALLANLRSFQRYRQGFYTNVAVGDGGVGGVQRRGGFFGGTGLTGFTGQGSGGFGEVGGATGFGRGGFAGGGGGGAGAGGTGFAGGGAGTVGGFVGLLQQLQQVRNTEDNLNAQVRMLGLLEANLQAGLIDIAQVDQFRQNIETERANLLQARNNLANSLDNFKVALLGLPPDLDVDLNDAMIQRFRFIDAATTELQTALEDFVAELPEAPTPGQLVGQVELLAELRKTLAERFRAADEELARLKGVLPARKQSMTADDVRRLDEDLAQLGETQADLRARYERTADDLRTLRTTAQGNDSGRTIDQTVALATLLGSMAQELSLVQARARLEAISLDRVRMTSERALAIARTGRLDWMNNRAALVDTWRLIAFNANALEAGLDVTLSGDLLTQGDNPVKFQSPTGTMRASLRFDGPFTRLLERNNYRQALIDYQRDRRRLIAFEDQTYLTLRRLLRQLDQLATNLEIQRRAMIIALRRVDQTREVINAPPQAVAAGEAPAELGPTAAQNLLTALSDLRTTQNNFMSVWLNYYSTRMVLTRELGLMELDPEGLWIELPLDDPCPEPAEEVDLPPAIPVAWLEKVGLPVDETAAAEAQAKGEAALSQPALHSSRKTVPAPIRPSAK